MVITDSILVQQCLFEIVANRMILVQLSVYPPFFDFPSPIP